MPARSGKSPDRVPHQPLGFAVGGQFIQQAVFLSAGHGMHRTAGEGEINEGIHRHMVCPGIDLRGSDQGNKADGDHLSGTQLLQQAAEELLKKGFTVIVTAR